MSTEDKLEEARKLIGQLIIKADIDEDEEKHDLCTVLYNLASVIREIRADIEIIKGDVREIRDK
ncbi:MAG: hypothetical protein H0T60_03160 [Acidobacteria bacterium]|nr:hypothetical protein [Acidobacteriota bacterium]